MEIVLGTVSEVHLAPLFRLAAAMAEGLKDLMQAPNRLVVVEPESAACVGQALLAGAPVRIAGDLQTCAQMLACGIASAPALEVLLRHDAGSVVIGENPLQATVGRLWASHGIGTTASGAAGVAGFLHVVSQPELRKRHQLTEASTVLLVITEGPMTESPGHPTRKTGSGSLLIGSRK